MATAGFVHYVMNTLHLTIDIRNVCVLIGLFFASNTAVVAYPLILLFQLFTTIIEIVKILNVERHSRRRIVSIVPGMSYHA